MGKQFQQEELQTYYCNRMPTSCLPSNDKILPRIADNRLLSLYRMTFARVERRNGYKVPKSGPTWMSYIILDIHHDIMRLNSNILSLSGGSIETNIMGGGLAHVLQPRHHTYHQIVLIEADPRMSK